MNIIMHGHDCEDAVRQILQLFFNIASDFDVVTTLTKNDSTYTAEARVLINDRSESASAEMKINNPEKRQITDLIKKSVFFACKKLSDMPTPWGISTGIRPAKTARMMLDENKTDGEILSFMEEEFLVTNKKAKLSLEVAKKEKLILSGKEKDGVSLYVGVPFCPTRCAYCSFISQAVEHNKKFIKPYVEALIKEIEETALMAEDYGYKAETIYFGGGTPTTLDCESLDRIIKKVKECFDISSLKEFTVEAGRPDTFSKEMLCVLRENTVDRISINPQTMNQKTLDKIGRFHTVEDTVRAFEMAKEFNCFSINADLIAGLPEETYEEYKKTLDGVLTLNPDAITLHTMYLKRAARLISDFEKLRFTKDAADMVDYTYDTLTKKGYGPYYLYKQRNTLGNLENAGFSKEGHESLYNIYIMEEVQTILAMGAGGSTKMVKGDRIERVFNSKDAADYIARIDEIIQKKEMHLHF